ncbi:hypothetical protein B0H11DRAFT_2246947 [Mycena galericulata]|nr:hypothetical protein B0H11DRAFT_2246947 [Mycena galericulata]
MRSDCVPPPRRPALHAPTNYRPASVFAPRVFPAWSAPDAQPAAPLLPWTLPRAKRHSRVEGRMHVLHPAAAASTTMSPVILPAAAHEPAARMPTHDLVSVCAPHAVPPLPPPRRP